jgi:hypothetical protein
MKTNYLKYTPALLLALFASSNAFAAATYDGTGAGVGDWTQYVETPPSSGGLQVNNAVDVTDIITGVVNGNAELFTSSDGMSNADFSTYTGTTTLIVPFLSGNSLTFSSLTHLDWDSGALDPYYAALYTNYVNTTTFPTLNDFINNPTIGFKALGGQQRASDPNIVSVYTEQPNGPTHVVLAGFLDAPQNPLLTNGVQPFQASEIVKVTDNSGNISYLWAVGPGSATASNLATDDGSYTGNYDFIIPTFEGGGGVDETPVPEPSGLALIIAGLTGFLGLRRKAVKA